MQEVTRSGLLVPENSVRYPVYHTKCRAVAFYTKVRLSAGERLASRDVIKIDGTTPEVGEESICGFCKKPIKNGGEITYELGLLYTKAGGKLISVAEYEAKQVARGKKKRG